MFLVTLDIGTTNTQILFINNLLLRYVQYTRKLYSEGKKPFIDPFDNRPCKQIYGMLIICYYFWHSVN